jgi:hypothetical protein
MKILEVDHCQMPTTQSVFPSYLTVNHTSPHHNIVPYLHVRFIHEFLSAAVAMDDGSHRQHRHRP